jgi:hypothetical protein
MGATGDHTRVAASKHSTLRSVLGDQIVICRCAAPGVGGE